MHVIGKGLAASNGRITGVVYFTSQEVMEAADKGEKVILVRHMTEPSDFLGMLDAAAFVTASGGVLSHTAVVARELNKPAVIGVEGLNAHIWESGFVRFGDHQVNRGDTITVDGTTGEVLV